MSKVTSKYQVTLPKVIADKYNIHPGDEIEWIAAGDSIRVRPPAHSQEPLTREERLRLFKDIMDRHRKGAKPATAGPPSARGWTSEELYTRGRPR